MNNFLKGGTGLHTQYVTRGQPPRNVPEDHQMICKIESHILLITRQGHAVKSCSQCYCQLTASICHKFSSLHVSACIPFLFEKPFLKAGACSMCLAVFSPEPPYCFRCCPLMPNQIVGMKV